MNEYKPLNSFDDCENNETTNTQNEKEKIKNKKMKYNYIHINHPELNSILETNMISTSKYTWYNMFPKILIEQFSKMANLYFLIIAVLQSIKEISYSGGQPVILLPLTFVIAINGVKDIFEDLKRKRSDDEENNRNCHIFERAKFINKKWSDIKLGHVIKVYKDEAFPCDLLLLKTSEEDNHCYIETQSIDGESSLKRRQCSSLIDCDDNEHIENIRNVIRCTVPNENIYDFMGTIYKSKNTVIIDEDYFVVNNDSLLLRGCHLKQTEFIIGVAVYIGHNTKSMKNAPKARTKTSKVEDIMNVQIVIIFFVQVLLSFIASMFNMIGYKDHLDFLAKYIYIQDVNDINVYTVSMFFTRMGTWLLIFTNFVPISLLVTMEMIKFVQGIFISWDVELYDKAKGSAKVQTSTLNEELGQVKFILTDKTGTLTMNNMTYKKMTIGDVVYDNIMIKAEKKDKFGEVTNCDFRYKDSQLEKDIHKGNNTDMINKFIMCINLCHSVVIDDIEWKKNNIIKYNATSPDELALINFTRSIGYIFTSRTLTHITIEHDNIVLSYQITVEIPYTSERKRMSVITKINDDLYRLYIKGADSAITSRSQNISNAIMSSLETYAKEGYRTLVFGYKDININEYNEWYGKYMEAMKNNEKEKVNQLYEEIEQGISVIGVTAIDDQLQEEVPETLYAFKSAGIKIWMLTGDKLDTAKSIAYSCKLINYTKQKERNYTLLEIPENSSLVSIETLIKRSITVHSTINSLIISSRELSLITSSEQSTMNLFYKLLSKCHCVICARVTPAQKSEMVSLIKHFDKGTVLAIGDGANDVKMITTADVGIGIVGTEGSQAARASDYALTKFSHLKKLLFVHGRESYRKNSFVVCYNFYKNALFVIPQFWMGTLNFFSGQTLYDRWIYQLFNPIFTCLPIIWYGIYDSEITHSELMSNSKYYIQGMISKLFHFNRFWKWILYGVIQGYFIFAFSFFAFTTSNSYGNILDMWALGTMAYSAVVLIANLKVLFYTNSHTSISTFLIIASIASYYITVYIMSFFVCFYNYDNFSEVFGDRRFVYSTTCVVGLVTFIDVGVAKISILFGLVKEGNKLSVKEIYDEEGVSLVERDEESIEEDCKLIVEEEA